ncbi:hypothetical protein [Flavilitoribacter nigricans]|uniref:Uncharacterized protein n=1 Tax=Flavilitoribacter nigricans (strain ATCC 23147 / DSM 23189 / NBRC 102662 / NCIMB 1420 / SS-2) TaxID=1122177 RepID=A0A2D0MY03_FLAN2|nr:hypothetical protein [Flavilitoribacter nigricans]PHN01125.1 hypothetical protein CRP01_38630 [Flavilitoribacter nigricans DSM 23189 = NBRC 102662]
MVIPIPVKEKRFCIKLSIRAHYPLSLGLAVFDPNRPNTFYFKRKVSFKPESFTDGAAIRHLSIPMPISSKHLNLALFEKGNEKDMGFDLIDFQLEKLEKKDVWASSERHRFMDFAIRFAQKAGYLPPNYYPSPKQEFLIHYQPSIRDVFGKQLVTPARIHRQMPYIQVSRSQFQQFSIPVRIAILAHEGCHYFNNTRSEKEADLCGLRYYLDVGFPSIEAVYAITKVFRFFDVPLEQQHLQRAKDIIDFISHYQQQPSLITSMQTK